MSKSDIGPFAIVPEWVAHGVTPGAVHLFVELALHANRNTNEAWPSRSRLAKRLEVSVDTVDRRMAELVGIGAVKKTLRRDERGPHSSLYLVAYARPPLGTDAAPPSRTDAAQNYKNLEPEPRTIKNMPEFDEFWAIYPRKVGKGKARSAFDAALQKTDAKTLIAAAEIYASSVAGADDSRFIAHPTSWLNGERWEDEYEDAAGKPAYYETFIPPARDEDEYKKFLDAVAAGPWSK
jgi:hypothetical protein